MDARRRLSLALFTSLALGACAHDKPMSASPEPISPATVTAAVAAPPGSPNGGPISYAQAWGGPSPVPSKISSRPSPVAARLVNNPRTPAPSGRIPDPMTGAADERSDGALRSYAYAPGRVFSVQTAPLRVTSLMLEPGETLIDKAAGDTIQWQIGETRSGAGESERTLVLIKPMGAGLSTNMVLTTSRRVYLIDLTSAARAFDPAVSWSYPDAPSPRTSDPISPEVTAASAGVQTIARSAYRVSPKGRAPSWTPTAVFDDGRQTFIAFPPDLDRGPAPLLFVEETGDMVLVNYRQSGSVFIVDRLFEAAELRLGDKPPAIVRITRDPRSRR